MMKPSPAELYAHVLRTEFLPFAYAAYRALYGKSLKRNWHHDAIAHALETTLTGERKLCIFMPPRNLKSFLVSIAWPAFLLGRNPSLKIIVVCYGEKLAEDLAYPCRRLMMSFFYRELFPGTQIKGRSAVGDFQTTRGGGRRATSIGGATTGVGGDILIIDDPIKADAVESETARLHALNWFQASFATRGDDKLGGAQVLVMQRLHEDDLGGYLVRAGWPALSLPAINDTDRAVPISRHRLHQWRAGDLLHPEHEPISVLDDQRRLLGPRRFSAQYLQDPLPVRGNLILAEYLKTYDGSPDDLEGGEIIQSWDPAASEAESACYSACITARRVGNVFYILDVYRGRHGFTALREKVIALNNRWRPSVILVEYTSNGIGLYDDLRARSVPGLASLVKIQPGSQSKYERMDAQTGLMAAGDLRLPKEAPWLTDFLHELLGFPNAKSDDMADALSQLLNWAKRKVQPEPLEGPELVVVDLEHEFGRPCRAWLLEEAGLPPDYDPWFD